MATMAMATVKKNNRYVSIITLLSLAITSSAFAGEWLFTPSIGIEETYSDNLLLRVINPQSSLVSQTNASIDTSYQSSVTDFLLSAEKSYLNYSHDSNLNDNYLTLNADGLYSPWSSGPTFIAGINIDNITRNIADNNLADLISGETIQSEKYLSGLEYDFGNSSYTVNSSLIYNIIRYEDNIANSDGYTAKIGSKNGNAAKRVFWQIDANYTKRKQSINSVNDISENRFINAKIGAITSISLNPFVRFYDEEVKGTSNNVQTTPSWGSGIRWQASSHLIIDFSYNFVKDETISDDYVETEINWQPSGRTSLVAAYSQRFFGDSYKLDFQHKTKRLTNSITYSDELAVYDRLSFDAAGLEPVNSQEYSLNRRLTWFSKLSLARTSFALNLSGTEREALSSGVIDDNFDASFTVERKTSARSTLTFEPAFSYTNFDKENPVGSRQKDYYRTLSLTYTRQLASSLSSFFTIRHVNRDSSRAQYNYDEVRAIINITKDF
jgi:hypothetical protein